MPGPNYDVALDGWLNLAAFHPADTARKQLGHEAVRQLVAQLGTSLHSFVPPSPQKSLAFSGLSYVLMLCNQSLATNGGPTDQLDNEELSRLASAGPLKPDPRVEAYKAQQRGETTPAPAELEPFAYQREYDGGVDEIKIGLTRRTRGMTVSIELDEGPLDVDNGASVDIDEPEALEDIAAYLLSMANALRAQQA